MIVYSYLYHTYTHTHNHTHTTMNTTNITCKQCLTTRAFYASNGLKEYAYICKNCNGVEGFDGFYCPMNENIEVVFPEVIEESQHMNCKIPCFCTSSISDSTQAPASGSASASAGNATYTINWCKTCLPRC